MRHKLLALMVAGLAVASPAWGAEAVKQSGTVVAIDVSRRVLTLSEMGPWTGPDSKPAERSYAVSDRTKVELATRSAGAGDGGWLGGFVESRLTPAEIRPGDFATVTTENRSNHAIAVSIDVVRP